MQDANLLSDPRGRTQTLNSVAPPRRMSESLNSMHSDTKARGERQADILQNNEEAHTAWSALMQEQASSATQAETHSGNSDFIETPSETITNDVWNTVSITEASGALANPRSEILSPHFQLAELAPFAQQDPAETNLLGPDGRDAQLPTTSLALPNGLNADGTSISPNVDVESTSSDITAIDFADENVSSTGIENSEITNITSQNADDTQTETNIELARIARSTSDADANLDVTVDRLNHEASNLTNASRDVLADDNTQPNPLTSNLDTTTGRAVQTLEADIASHIVDPKTTIDYIKSSDPSSADNEVSPANADTNVNVTANAELALEIDAVASLEEVPELDLRVAQSDLVPAGEVLEDVRFSEIVNNSTEELAKDFYVKTGNATNALGLASGLTPVTDSTITLDTAQFSLGAVQSTTPQTAASIAINAAINVPTAGPNTVAIVSEAMLLAKETSKGVTVQLDPPEMGRVYIDFIFEADRQVNIVVKTETLEAQNMLRERSDDFLAMLKEEGLDGATLSFEFHDNQEFEGFDQSFGSGSPETIMTADDGLQNPLAVQTAYSKNTSYTDGLDLRL